MSRRLALPALLFAAAACATAEKVAREALALSPEGRRIVSEFDRYAKVAHVLKKYHDSGELGEDDLLAVLRGAGVLAAGRTAKPARGKGPKAPAPKPFPVPAYGGDWRWPLEAGVVSSEYGPRWGKQHRGLDIAADMGVPVHASAPGSVVYSGDQLTGYGNVVVLRHDQKTTTLYAHNKANRVKVGQQVAAGQVIALLGSTGRSTGPHVHFELREADRPVDPRARMPKSRF